MKALVTAVLPIISTQARPSALWLSLPLRWASTTAPSNSAAKAVSIWKNTTGWAVNRRWSSAHPWGVGLGLVVGMTLLSALALPGNAPLALAAGLCFGVPLGAVIIVVGSTLGASLAFLAARWWWRDAVQRRWGAHLAGVQAAVARDGAFYLFSMRVAPVIPFPVINPLMGLTAMRLRTFFAVSLLGMLAGSLAYAWAGDALARAQALPDLASPGLLAGLLALALLPWGARAAWRLCRPATRQA